MEQREKTDKEKKQILLRMSPSLWAELNAWSEDDFRSLNGQIEYLLTECVRQRKKAKSAEHAHSDDTERSDTNKQ